MRTFADANLLARDVHNERAQVLEDLFVLELMVTSEMCGFTPQERRAWAMQSVLKAEQAGDYISAWKRAKGAAWKRVNSLADDLRRTCGDDPAQWETRLARLESTAGDNLHPGSPAPGPQRGSRLAA